MEPVKVEVHNGNGGRQVDRGGGVDDQDLDRLPFRVLKAYGQLSPDRVKAELVRAGR